MNQTPLASFRPANADSTVRRLKFAEKPVIDPAPIRKLYQDKGEVAAEELLCRVLEDIFRRRDLVASLHAACNFRLAAQEALRLAAVADQIGVVGIADISRQLSDCFEQQNQPAIAPVLSRLCRAVEVTHSEIWQALYETG